MKKANAMIPIRRSERLIRRQATAAAPEEAQQAPQPQAIATPEVQPQAIATPEVQPQAIATPAVLPQPQAVANPQVIPSVLLANDLATSQVAYMPQPQLSPSTEDVNFPNIAVQRLKKELRDIKRDKLEGVHVQLIGNALFDWLITFRGPRDTPYENGCFQLEITFNHGYPFHPPKVKFLTHIFHCNIYNGRICVDFLGQKWSPVMPVGKLVLSILLLLMEPNPQSPLNLSAATLYKSNRAAHDAKAREWTNRFAKARTMEQLVAAREGPQLQLDMSQHYFT
ncbi:CG10862 [Drosophila busckii]|uniref:CG10862 n=1 Tax=Drosophila busckii TaxID=30019 RepID=A0A0M3QWC3_DROBS|nr:ubiquitin-conjugating enzyme E2-16 kDa [Drosophila busckii]ALC43893.1 CG10862 [Drosophila busckii]